MSDMSHVMPSWWLWAVGVFLTLGAVLGWNHVRNPDSHLSRGSRVGLWLLRVAIGLVLMVLILDWRTETSRTETEKPLIHVLIDDSASMARTDTPGNLSRFNTARTFLEQNVMPAWNDPEHLRVGRAGEGYRDGLPSDAAPKARRSALGRALREVMENHADQPFGGVIVFTDGAVGDEDELREVIQDYREARVPVYPWVIGSGGQPGDVRILTASLRQPSASQPNLRLEARIDSPGFSDRQVSLKVSLDDQLLHQENLRLEGHPQSISTEFVSPYRGLHVYKVAIEELDGEATHANNIMMAASELRREPIRVLYMEGSEPAETAFLRDGLEADPEMEVTCMHFPGAQPVEILARQALQIRGKDTRVFKDGVGRDVPSVCHPTRGYPQKIKDLLRYDVVIFSDIIKEAYTSEQLQATVAFVEEFGGGFVMIGGNTSFGSGDYQKTVIDKLMPIEVSNHNDPLWVRVTAEVTNVGWKHPIMQVGATTEETRDAWTRSFTGFAGLNYVQRAKPGAYVLARTSKRYPGADNLVLLAVQQIGRGRTMAFTSDCTKDWGTQFETSWGPHFRDNSYYRKFWNNTIRWLAADRIARKGGQAILETSTGQAAPGETIRIRVPAASPTTHGGLGISVTTPDRKTSNLPIQWNSGKHAWEGNYSAASEGDIVITATYRNEEGNQVDTRTGVSIRNNPNEEVAVATRPDLMNELASGTQGQVIDQASVREVLARIGERAIPVTWKRNIPVWDRWWILVPLLALVILEWLLRRRREPVA